MSRPSAVLAAALCALVPADAAFACIHGARTVSVMTGQMSGSTREEKLVAKLNPGSNVAVKLFVGPANAQIRALQLSPETLARHEQLARTANRVLQEESAVKFRGGPVMRSLGAPQQVAELRTNNGVVVTVERLPGYGWSDIVNHLKFADDPSISESMELWTQKVKKANRAIYVAKIDLSQVANGQAAREDALGVGVSMTYQASGDKLRRELVIDKWLEYLGSPGVATMFKTEFTEDQLTADFSAVVENDGILSGGLSAADRAKAAFVRNGGGNGQDLGLTIPEKPGIITITVLGSDIFFKNNSLRMTPRMLAPALAASGGTAPARSMQGLPREIKIQGPFGNN